MRERKNNHKKTAFATKINAYTSYINYILMPINEVIENGKVNNKNNK